MNAWILGAKLALEDYPFAKKEHEHNCGYKDCLGLLINVYDNYKAGRVSRSQVIEAVGLLKKVLSEQEKE